MFGLSLSEILFTVGIVIVVWRGWKMMEFFRDKISDDPEERPARKKPARKSNWFSNRFKRQPMEQPRENNPALDLVPCPHCGAYIANGEFCTDPRTCPLNKKSQG